MEDKISKLPWNEKYRPKKIADVAHQEQVTETLEQTLQTGELPHMLFYGPPGTGKTTTALALVKELFGPKVFTYRVKEMNASDDRGIKAVREKIKTFAKLKVTRKDPNYLCPPYKVIILDEADSMTHDAQAALRRTMEEYIKDTRFILCCNYVSRIIEPLQSRCQKYYFKPLGKDGIRKRLLHICEQEGVDMQEDAIDAVIHVSEGDCRRSIGFLQSASQAFGVEHPDCPGKIRVSADAILNVASAIPMEWTDRMVTACCHGTIADVDKVTEDFLCEGYAPETLFVGFREALRKVDLPCYQMAKIALALAEIDGLFYVKNVPSTALVPQLLTMTHHYAHSPPTVAAQDEYIRNWWSDVNCNFAKHIGKVYW